MMNRKLGRILMLATLWLLTGCLEKHREEAFEEGIKEVVVQIELPGALSGLDKSGFRVAMRNTHSATGYVLETDAQGEARVLAEYGTYALTVTKNTEVEGESMLLHAARNFTLKPAESAPVVQNLGIKATARGAIILKEFYFHTTRTPDGSANYIFDQYLSLCNNSDRVQYLDGLGVGFHGSFNSGVAASFVKYWIAGSTELRDSVPINAFGLMFPGTGQQYPLQPGEEVVLALSAIEHTPQMSARPMNFTASNVWAMYIDRFGSGSTQKAPTAGVRRMECFCERAPGTSVTISRFSPAAVLYRLPVDPYDYVREGPVSGRRTGQVMFSPPRYVASPVIMIPRECVLDAVEFKNVATHVPRLCSEVSLHPLLISTATSSGASYIRKVDEEASLIVGRTVYRDTNDSSEDWTMLAEPTLATEYRNPKNQQP